MAFYLTLDILFGMETPVQKKRLLLADDDKQMVTVLADLLESKGFEILTAFEGVRVVEMCLKRSPDLIVLDLKMPAGTGQTILQLLKNTTQTKNIPILVLTGVEDKGIEGKLKEMGAAGYIKKPYDSKNIVELIRSLLLNNKN